MRLPASNPLKRHPAGRAARARARGTMIHYALRCGNAHEFDGWFRSSASFDQQAAGLLLDCPVCGNTRVQRALMAPRIAIHATRPLAESAPVAEPVPKPAIDAPHMAVAPSVPATLPDGVRAALQRIRAQVEKTCDYVGPHFAREVRAMAEPGAAYRPVYGEATPDEAAALVEDGIDVARIPWVPRADS
jgi:hypothetical protein